MSTSKSVVERGPSPLAQRLLMRNVVSWRCPGDRIDIMECLACEYTYAKPSKQRAKPKCPNCGSEG